MDGCLLYEIRIGSASYACIHLFTLRQNLIGMFKPLFNYLILVISCTILFMSKTSGQQPLKNYEKEWKIADDFSAKNLPKSALAQVKKIYALAKKEKQDEGEGGRVSQ